MIKASLIFIITFLAYSNLGVAENKPSLNVIEMFTSNQCSDVPARNAILSELNTQDNMLIISCHTTYFDRDEDYDPYALDQCDQRNKSYTISLDEPSAVKIPHFIINGRTAANGTYHNIVRSAYKMRRSDNIATLDLKLDNSILAAALPDFTGKIDQLRDPVPLNPFGIINVEAPLTIWLMGFDKNFSTSFETGANAGQTIDHHHTIRFIRRIKDWKGTPENLVINLEEDGLLYGYAMLIQPYDTGPLIATGIITAH